MTAQAPVPEDHPMMIAWKSYKLSWEYSNTRKWALQDEHVDGSLWSAFAQGWEACFTAVKQNEASTQSQTGPRTDKPEGAE